MDNYEKIALETAIVTEYQAAYHKQKALEGLEDKYKEYGYDKAEIIKLLKEKGIFKKPGRPKATLKNSEDLVDTKGKDIKIVKNIENKPYSEENFVENIENTKVLPAAVISCIRDEIASMKYSIDSYDKKILEMEKYKEQLYSKLDELGKFLRNNGVGESEDIV